MRKSNLMEESRIMPDDHARTPPFDGYSLDGENPVLEVLLSHRSIRKYKDTAVAPEALDRILEAAQRAPSWCNYQTYSIIVVDDRPTRERLRELCAHQEFVADCGVLLVFCADISRIVAACEKQGYEFRSDHLNTQLIAHGDAFLACQNAALAAESMGLGTCMLGNIRYRPGEVSKLLALPHRVFATVGLTIGHPDEDPGVKPRLPRKVVVSHNRYCSDHVAEGLEEYDRTTRLSGMYGGRLQPLAEVDPELEETFGDDTYGWLEHTARRVGGSYEDRWRGLAEFLEARGFSRE
jgi:FMN reductase [NAD(P)H]